MLVFAATPDENGLLERWIVDRIPHVHGSFGPCVTAGVVRSGRLVAGVAFHDWQPSCLTLQLSMAADTALWASRDVLAGLTRYAFVTCGANKLWTAIPHDEARTIRFNRGVGLKHEGTLRQHFGPKRHAVICSMTRAEWQRSRWFKE